MAISANVMNIETTESGTTVITLSLPDFCHTITVPENYIDGLPVIAAQPYGVIMVEDGAADDMPVVCMNNNKEFFSIALSALMAADVHDTISFATPYVFPENIDPSKYLAGLADVDITNPQNGQALIYDSTSEKWENGAAGVSTLSALTDTTITTPTNGQVLTYDSTASKWKNADASGGESGFGYNSMIMVAEQTINLEFSGEPENVYFGMLNGETIDSGEAIVTLNGTPYNVVFSEGFTQFTTPDGMATVVCENDDVTYGQTWETATATVKIESTEFYVTHDFKKASVIGGDVFNTDNNYYLINGVSATVDALSTGYGAGFEIDLGLVPSNEDLCKFTINDYEFYYEYDENRLEFNYVSGIQSLAPTIYISNEDDHLYIKYNDSQMVGITIKVYCEVLNTTFTEYFNVPFNKANGKIKAYYNEAGSEAGTYSDPFKAYADVTLTQKFTESDLEGKTADNIIFCMSDGTASRSVNYAISAKEYESISNTTWFSVISVSNSNVVLQYIKLQVL